MTRSLMAGAVLALAITRFGDSTTPQPVDSPNPTHEVKLNSHTFTLPAGFDIELVANSPLCDRPITIAFDDAGRLYVTDSSGSNDKVDKQLVEKPHRVVRLEDSDGDGCFDKSIVFADKLMFPEGSMWLDGSLYVSAPPSIWKLTDTDGDGVADQREEWFAGKTLTGCANDLHGPYLGPDGWIYWAKGAFARQTYERVGKSLRVIPDAPLNILGKEVPVGAAGVESASPQPPNTWSTRASHIFRCRPDGSGLEVVMTGGMDNPVDVVFTPGGERIVSNTFLVHPGGGLRDGLLHAVYGGIYGKDHDPIHEPQHKWTGPDLMPVLSHLGPAAPCGLVRYESAVFDLGWPADERRDKFQDNLFACLFNMHKITRHVLEADGATFKSKDSDFLVSSNLDFHPTDILEDADGSLIVVDTGGWYKLCCPTSQLHKPDILGAIYRVRRSNLPKLPPNYATDWSDPRGRKLAWDELTTELLTHRYLADERPAVRDRATRELAQRGASAVPALAEAARVPPFAELRRNAVWALTRIDSADARAAARAALGDRDEIVRQAALHSVSLWRDELAIEQLTELLSSGSRQNQRVVAEALGRIGQPKPAARVLATLLDLHKATASDPMLEHSLMFALFETCDAKLAQNLGFAVVWAGAHSGKKEEDLSDVKDRRSLLILLDQTNAGLKGADTVKGLEAPWPLIRETATWIISRHPEWGDDLAKFLHGRIQNKDLTDDDRVELQRLLVRFAKSSAIQELLEQAVRGDLPAIRAAVPGSEKARLLALQVMREAGLKEKELPGSWVTAVAEALASDDPELLAGAAATARTLAIPKGSWPVLAVPLTKLARSSDRASSVRLDAAAAVPGGLALVDDGLFELLQASLDPDTPVGIRAAAADVLAKAKLTTEQLAALADSLRVAGPLEVDRLLAAFEQSSDSGVGAKLVASLRTAPSLTALRPDAIQRAIAKCSPAVHEAAQELFAAINVNVAQQKERLDELLASLTNGSVEPGDIRRGQAVFMGQKAACFSCHQMGYRGGNVGPDLTRIGGVRNERDLVESIAFPSASFVRSYEPVVVATKSGKIVSGFLKKDAPDEITLAVNATETARVARDDIEEIRPGSVSVMPSGLDQQLGRQELADLIAFLKNAK